MSTKEPRQIALDAVNAVAAARNASDRTVSLIARVAQIAVEADRANPAPLAPGNARFVVEFDSPAWESASESERQAWLDEVTDDLAASVYVASVEVGR